MTPQQPLDLAGIFMRGCARGQYGGDIIPTSVKPHLPNQVYVKFSAGPTKVAPM
jgi:hypothetical protein